MMETIKDTSKKPCFASFREQSPLTGEMLRGNAGFTLLELVMSITIFTIVLLGSVKMVADQRRTYHEADQYMELQGKVRAALDIISGEIRMAGSGVNQSFANPIYYAFNDTSLLNDYPTLTDLKDSTLGQNREFGVIGFQYDRNVETRDDLSVLRDTITNRDVMLLALSDTSDSNVLKSVKMETYTDEGATALTLVAACSLSSSTNNCKASYVSSGPSDINLKGTADTEVFSLNMYSITSSGAYYDTSEIMDNVISFGITYYLDTSDTGYADVATIAAGGLGDNRDNDSDGDTDEKGELATITDTTDAGGLCDGGKVLCSPTGGILTIPLSTRNTTDPTAPADTVIATSTINPGGYIHDITSASAVSFTSTPTIAAGSAGDYVTIVNTGQYPITFTDNDILTNSNLELKRDTVTLSPNQSVSFQYSSSKWVQTTAAVANIAAIKITLTARSDKRDLRTGKYLVYSGTITTKLRGYAL